VIDWGFYALMGGFALSAKILASEFSKGERELPEATCDWALPEPAKLGDADVQAALRKLDEEFPQALALPKKEAPTVRKPWGCFRCGLMMCGCKPSFTGQLVCSNPRAMVEVLDLGRTVAEVPVERLMLLPPADIQRWVDDFMAWDPKQERRHPAPDPQLRDAIRK
jgi:hypothetical protein